MQRSSQTAYASVALGLLEQCVNDILGKTFDLGAAYRRLGIREGSLLYSYIVCFGPVARRPVIFQMLTEVPFGATRAVYSFLRIARCLWWIGCKRLKFRWTNFDDDFATFRRHLHPIQKPPWRSSSICLAGN